MILELRTSVVSCFEIKVITKKYGFVLVLYLPGLLILLNQKEELTPSYHVNVSLINKKDKCMYL